MNNPYQISNKACLIATYLNKLKTKKKFLVNQNLPIILRINNELTKKLIITIYISTKIYIYVCIIFIIKKNKEFFLK